MILSFYLDTNNMGVHIDPWGTGNVIVPKHDVLNHWSGASQCRREITKSNPTQRGLGWFLRRKSRTASINCMGNRCSLSNLLYRFKTYRVWKKHRGMLRVCTVVLLNGTAIQKQFCKRPSRTDWAEEKRVVPTEPSNSSFSSSRRPSLRSLLRCDNGWRWWRG